MEQTRMIDLNVKNIILRDYKLEKDKAYMQDCWTKQDWELVEKGAIEHICRRAKRNNIVVYKNPKEVSLYLEPHKFLDEEHVAVVMLKPGFTAPEIRKMLVDRLDEAGLTILKHTDVYLDKDDAKLHYPHLVAQPFYPYLEKYMTSGPCYAYLVYGDNAIDKVREIACGKGGSTKDSRPDGIRYQVQKMLNPNAEVDVTKNVVHATGYADGKDKYADARREVAEFIRWDAKAMLMKSGIFKLRIGDHQNPNFVHNFWNGNEDEQTQETKPSQEK